MLEDDYPEGRTVREEDLESCTGDHYQDILLKMNIQRVRLEKLSEALEGDYRERTEIRLKTEGEEMTVDNYLDPLRISESSEEFELLDAETVIYRPEDEKVLGKIEYRPRRDKHIFTDPEHLYTDINL